MNSARTSHNDNTADSGRRGSPARKLALLALPLAALLLLSGCGPGSYSAGGTDPVASFVANIAGKKTAVEFGDTYRYNDGLAVTVEALNLPPAEIVTSLAASLVAERKQHSVTFRFTATNNSSHHIVVAPEVRVSSGTNERLEFYSYPDYNDGTPEGRAQAEKMNLKPGDKVTWDKSYITLGTQYVSLRIKPAFDLSAITFNRHYPYPGS